MLWGCFPRANVGVVIARSPSVVVLDIDPRNGGDLDLIRELPRTLTVRSGGFDMGVHLYFRRPKDQPAEDARVVRIPGVDDKSNGYVVGPGSVHPTSGRLYEIIHDRPLAELPGTLLEPKPRLADGGEPASRPASRRPRTHVSNPVAYVRSVVEQVVAEVSSASLGDRNSCLYRGAFRVGMLTNELGTDWESAAHRLVWAGAEAGLPSAEVRATILSAFRAALAHEEHGDR